MSLFQQRSIRLTYTRLFFGVVTELVCLVMSWGC